MNFKFGDKQLRTVQHEGEPYFVLKDLETIEGISQQAMSKRVAVMCEINPQWRVQLKVVTSSGTQLCNCVSEAGLNYIIIRSNKPETFAFKRWVCDEVLPSIKRHGGYHVDPAL